MPLPLPSSAMPPPVPGISEPMEAPGDRMSQLAEQMGSMKGQDSVTAMQDMVEGLDKLRSAAAKDPKIAPIVQAMLAVLQTGAGPPGPPGLPPGSIAGPVAPAMPVPGGPGMM